MLVDKIKQVALRTYLLAFSSKYDSLSHEINRDLIASWDQPTGTIVMRKVEPSALQVIALQFAEKATSLVDANERLLDSKTGNYGYKDNDWRGGGGDRYNRGNTYGGGNQRGGFRSGGGGRGGRGGGRGGRGKS